LEPAKTGILSSVSAHVWKGLCAKDTLPVTAFHFRISEPWSPYGERLGDSKPRVGAFGTTGEENIGAFAGLCRLAAFPKDKYLPLKEILLELYSKEIPCLYTFPGQS
jgi:hypothetical protein